MALGQRGMRYLCPSKLCDRSEFSQIRDTQIQMRNQRFADAQSINVTKERPSSFSLTAKEDLSFIPSDDKYREQMHIGYRVLKTAPHASQPPNDSSASPDTGCTMRPLGSTLLNQIKKKHSSNCASHARSLPFIPVSKALSCGCQRVCGIVRVKVSFSGW